MSTVWITMRSTFRIWRCQMHRDPGRCIWLRTDPASTSSVIYALCLDSRARSLLHTRPVQLQLFGTMRSCWLPSVRCASPHLNIYRSWSWTST